MSAKKIIAALIVLVFLAVAGVSAVVIAVSSSLPNLITVADYEPLLVTEVFDRKGEKIGEFFREKRTLVPYDQIPEKLVQAFIASEDSAFFEHGGINYLSVLRASLANLRAGRKAQGGSTITMQVARSLLLSSEKTYTRKIKEVMLSYKMESHLSKKDILWLYLNQIYLGQGAYGIGTAAEVYFRKPVKDLSVGEAALLAGLPQAPSRYSPISNPKAAKERQRYVLIRMAEENFISKEDAHKIAEEPLKVFVRINYKEKAPFYLETLRQLLVKKLGETTVLDKGLKIYTGLDLEKQVSAQEQVRIGLRELDKRQGFRGAEKNLQKPEEVAEFLLKSRNSLIEDFSPVRVIRADGSIEEYGPLNLSGKDKDGNLLPNLPSYLSIDQIVSGVVSKIDDKNGLVYVRLAESKGLIDLDSMKWARKPDPEMRAEAAQISKPSEALKQGDIIQVRIVGKTVRSDRLEKLIAPTAKKGKAVPPPADLPTLAEYLELELEQDPVAEGSLISLDQKTGDVIALVGGYDFQKSEFNRALQAARQTGSAFKALVYASALDKGYSPTSPIIDAPIVYEEEAGEEGQGDQEELTKKWKPLNHSKKFAGEILFRNALIRSLNIPTVKIIEKLGVDWVANYARRLGIFSPLNMDLSMGLGSSGVTLYEMTKVFAEFGRLGKRIRPVLAHKVIDRNGQTLLETIGLDERFEKELGSLEEEFEQKRQDYLKNKKNEPAADPTVSLTANKTPAIFFDDPDQLMKPTTAYVITSLLQGVIDEPGGTGGAARALGRPVAGKTGTTNGYYDAWFIGYTPDIVSGVWVGFDHEKSLGRGEVGGKSALPIWLNYMKAAHEGLPARNFSTPDGIVFANIDNETGKLASTTSKQVVRQAFTEGSEPEDITNDPSKQEDQNFYKEDLSE